MRFKRNHEGMFKYTYMYINYLIILISEKFKMHPTILKISIFWKTVTLQIFLLLSLKFSFANYARCEQK